MSFLTRLDSNFTTQEQTTTTRQAKKALRNASKSEEPFCTERLLYVQADIFTNACSIFEF